MYSACFFHDLKYWVGGSDTERLIADAELLIDIAKLGLPRMARIMFAGVQVGGGEAWRQMYSWGFGHQKYKKQTKGGKKK